MPPRRRFAARGRCWAAAGLVLAALCSAVPTAAAQTARTPAAAKPAAKPAAKKPAVRKPAARKPAAGKPAARPTQRPAAPAVPARTAADDSTAAREARAAFGRYTEAFNARNDAEAIAFYADDAHFHWVEDGRIAYTSAAAILESLANVRALFPTIRFEPGEARTTVLGRDAVQLTVPFTQHLVDAGGVESTFQGTMTLALTRNGTTWRVLTGHTSLRRPTPP